MTLYIYIHTVDGNEHFDIHVGISWFCLKMRYLKLQIHSSYAFCRLCPIFRQAQTYGFQRSTFNQQKIVSNQQHGYTLETGHQSVRYGCVCGRFILNRYMDNSIEKLVINPWMESDPLVSDEDAYGCV